MDSFDKRGDLVDSALQDHIVNLIETSYKSNMLNNAKDITIQDLNFSKNTNSGTIYIHTFTKAIEPTIEDIVLAVGKDAVDITVEDLDNLEEEQLVDTMTLNHYDEVKADAKTYADDENELNAFGATFGDSPYNYARWGGYLEDTDEEIVDGYYY